MLIWKIFLVMALCSLPTSAIKFNKFWTNYTIDATNYYKMPPLNKFDDFDACMQVYEEKARYCYVRTAIKPDLSSQLYNYIAEFSSMQKQHFRHDKLTRGICLNTCRELLDEAAAAGENYYVDEFKLDYAINFDFIGFVNATEDREKYNNIVNQCINVELKELYGLEGYSSIEYCTQNDVTTDIDGLDIFFITACSILVIIICMSSAYDEKLRITQLRSSKIEPTVADHYRNAPKALSHKFFVAFSVTRNWQILSAPTKPEMRDLRSISAMRIFTMIAIFYGHCSWFAVALPIQNPFFVENSYHRLWSMLVINGGNLVQSFFFFSGFLNSIVLLNYVANNEVRNFAIMVKTVIYRFLRFAPVLLFLIILHSTLLYRLDSGPFWDKFTYYERQACRENMWTNLLFINNYVSGDMKCMVHTWFISADFHLSVIATGILMLVYNFPKRQNLLLFGSVFVSFLIAFVHFYITKLEPILILSPETLRNQLITTSAFDRYYFDFHSPTHLNTGNYLIGVVFGYFYYKRREAGYRHRRTFLLQCLWHLSYMATFALCFMGIYFYEHTIEKGFVSALLGATFKHLYGPILGVLMVGVFYRYGWIMPKIFNYGFFRVLARLSFSVYMVHVTIGALFIAGHKFPFEVNNANLAMLTAAVYSLSHGAALVLVVCIEIPTHVFYKTIINEIIDKPKNSTPAKKGLNNNGYDERSLPSRNLTTKC